MYGLIGTPPPDSESDDKADNMMSKAEIKIGQPATFDGKSADASYWIGLVHM